MTFKALALAAGLGLIAAPAFAQGSGASGDIGGSRAAPPSAMAPAPVEPQGSTVGSSVAPKKMTKAKTAKAAKKGGAEKE